MRNNTKSGITLVSLVITIIILLILAGVAINLAVDSDGLFAKTGQAANSWNTAVGTEKNLLDNLYAVLDTVSPSEVTINTDKTTYPAGWDDTKLEGVASSIGGVAPIPKGFTASDIEGENTIVGGLVIYEGTEKVSTDSDAITTRNQYVWIPVSDINSMVMCSGASAESPCRIVADSNGNLSCEVHMVGNYDADAIFLCGKLYATSIGNNFLTDGTFKPTYKSNSGLREPAVVTGDDGTSNDAASNNYHGLGTGTAGATAFLTQMKGDFEEMAKSVKKYGGFYISRYEVQANAESKKGVAVMNASTNSQMWYGLYGNLRKNVQASGATVAKTQMIWGSQYDQVMKFVNGKNSFDVKTQLAARHDSTGYKVSGNNSADLVCNIYDLEGNYFEWTQEAIDAVCRVGRGGIYISTNPASDRQNFDPSYTYGFYSSRSTLYVAL